MSIYETTTRDEELTPNTFHEFAQIFFKQNDMPMFTTKEDAVEILEHADTIAKALEELDMDEEEIGVRKVMMGSILGEAFLTAFGGDWEYSSKQERWVVASPVKPDGIVYLNVFKKLEAFHENGDTDSLEYFFRANREIVEGEQSI